MSDRCAFAPTYDCPPQCKNDDRCMRGYTALENPGTDIPYHANAVQVGGTHYKKHGEFQHWDMVAHFGLDYYQGQITKYLFRWRDKNGLEDLAKAQHYLTKYRELAETGKLPGWPKPAE